MNPFMFLWNCVLSYVPLAARARKFSPMVMKRREVVKMTQDTVSMRRLKRNKSHRCDLQLVGTRSQNTSSLRSPCVVCRVTAMTSRAVPLLPPFLSFTLASCDRLPFHPSVSSYIIHINHIKQSFTEQSDASDVFSDSDHFSRWYWIFLNKCIMYTILLN